MNRRKAIVRISLAGLGIAAAGTAYKWWDLVKSPDFSPLDKDLLAALCETIIPATDTPGARDTDTHDFVIRMIRYCTPRKEQNNFLHGLREIQSYCQSKYGQPYQRCTHEQQTAALTRFEEKGKPFNGKLGKVELRLMGRPFFAILKDYTIQGYCTSQPGATKGLNYVYIPGSFKSCIPLEPGQKAWATN
ncbi:MAG TPA: gluconate 2-dehydrogenase subunit 3 family protein [Puia sp.]|nr:gluconate 2-dehydrogenase subunit 3 family protein [Puia sp.]